MTVIGTSIKIFKILFLIRSNIYAASYAMYEKNESTKKAAAVIIYTLLVDLALLLL